MQFPQNVDAKRSELVPQYNRAGGLDQVLLDGTVYVERIAYDAKGQRALVAYGNGVMTRYAYDFFFNTRAVHPTTSLPLCGRLRQRNSTPPTLMIRLSRPM